MKTKLYFLTPLLLFALSACNSDDPSSSETDVPAAKERQDIPLTRSETQLADHTLDFSLALLRQASLQEAGKNMLVSPLGTAALLNLMANGAESHTADELYAVLSPSGVSAGELNDFFSKLNTWLPELDNTTSLAQAYSLWMDDLSRYWGQMSDNWIFRIPKVSSSFTTGAAKRQKDVFGRLIVRWRMRSW